jgi:AcrR family transcriptional regulator
MDLFLERGIGGTTVSDIERAVGLAAGTGSFYRHFPAKEAVVVPALERRLAAIFEQIQAERADTAQVDDPGDRAATDLRRLLDDMRAVQPIWTLVMLERTQFPELVRVFVDGLGMSAWSVDLDAEPERAIVMAALSGFHQLSLFDGSPYREVDADAFIEKLVTIVAPLTVGRA